MTTDFDFDTLPARRDTGSVKFDALGQQFGATDLIPLWVADMDFAAPPCVLQALSARLEHPVFGYSIPPESLYEAFCGWFARRHGWHIDPARVLWAPGTNPILVAAIEALTRPGDQIVVPAPVYHTFLDIVKTLGRRLITTPIAADGDTYRLDLEHLAQCAASGATMLLFCSPHNPLGRAWTVEELDQVVEIAQKYQLTIVSDEVHADFVYPGHTHTPMALRTPPDVRLITTLSSAKTFNLPGMGLSAAVTSHPDDLARLRAALMARHLNPFNPLTMAAYEAGWRAADAWVDALIDYLDQNRRWLHTRINALGKLRTFLPDATFLMWVDCRDLSPDDAHLLEFFVQQAQLAVNPGPPYGPGARGHIRLNFATNRPTLTRALEHLHAQLPR